MSNNVNIENCWKAESKLKKLLKEKGIKLPDYEIKTITSCVIHEYVTGLEYFEKDARVDTDFWGYLYAFINGCEVDKLSKRLTERVYNNDGKSMSIHGKVKFCVKQIFKMAQQSYENNKRTN